MKPDSNVENNARKIRALVVDDESLARQGLIIRLEELGQVEVLRACRNGQEALAAVAELAPDLIFLDIQMPGMTGFDVIEQLQQDNMPLVIFVTAYDEFAVTAFDLHAVDYLLKPIEQERLAAAVDKAAQQLRSDRSEDEKRRLLDIVMGLTGRSEEAVLQLMSNNGAPIRYPGKLAIKDGASTTFVPVREIDWIDAAGDYM